MSTRRQSQQHEQLRKGQDEVREAADAEVDPLAHEAADDAEDGADHDADEGGGGGDQHGKRHTRNQPGEQVTTGLRLDAQQVLRAHASERAGGHRAQALDKVAVQRLRVDDPEPVKDRRRQRHQDEQEDDDQGRHGDLVAAQPGPGDLPRRTTDDLAGLLRGNGRRHSVSSCPALKVIPQSLPYRVVRLTVVEMRLGAVTTDGFPRLTAWGLGLPLIGGQPRTA